MDCTNVVNYPCVEIIGNKVVDGKHTSENAIDSMYEKRPNR